MKNKLHVLYTHSGLKYKRIWVTKVDVLIIFKAGGLCNKTTMPIGNIIHMIHAFIKTLNKTKTVIIKPKVNTKQKQKQTKKFWLCMREP